MIVYSNADHADIALLLEGTFPYVSGGVSSWVNQIINGFPQYRYALVFIGSRLSDYGQMRYRLPGNVVHLETHYINELLHPPVRASTGCPRKFARVAQMHDWFRCPDAGALAEFSCADALETMLPTRGIDQAEFLYSEAAWEYVTAEHRKRSTDPSFIDYFWTVRSMHEPLWMLAKAADGLIPVRAFHSVSTGYAGLLGALLKQRRQRPFILSEHGIYTQERKIELLHSQWIRDNRDLFQKDRTAIGYFRRMWIRFFEGLGQVAYQSADRITALYEQNRLRQIADGAPAGRTQSIPNGVKLERFVPLRVGRPASIPPILCLIGRLVPIKDVKTFIRAMRTVLVLMPDAQGWIAGPQDEDPDYARECHQLVVSLGLGQHVKFLGFQKMEDVLPKVGLVVLSSISEALPLVLLEGFAAGVPAVTTDVGACRQLIYGSDLEDQALGAAGCVTGLADPEALGRAAVSLLRDEQAWRRSSAAAIRRVEKFYTEQQMFARFGSLYESVLEQGVY